MEIHFSPETESSLDRIAKSIGCSIHELIQKIVADHMRNINIDSTYDRQKRREAVAGILVLQKHVKPDPEGLTLRDYINFGRS